ncbi:hypothetical protein [Natranaeroarchaeum aerophilus]|uniref:Envelope protein N-terminal domain-containing protein n=1 Tax=Natranaeroarchaeum aerophilus TaxID=2917711 RepID=A0AAE3FP41_9EURY|nr:hypothetical protein [Natranaeroarchaeum aerophilus]MCL9812511.1 hypothetical protein [Natranaeroarchaeum aerophilus]
MTDESGPCLTRRRVLQGTAAGAATVVGVGSQHGPTQEAKAIPPAVAAVGVYSAGKVGVGAGVYLRDNEVVGSNPPPEGLTPEVLNNNSYETLRKRHSNNQSDFIDNKNILEGISHPAYAEGKVAAIEALNDQESQNDVYDASLPPVDDYETTVLSNFYKSWNETCDELETISQRYSDHPDAGIHEVIGGTSGEVQQIEKVEPELIELPDGSEMEVDRLWVEYQSQSGDMSYGEFEFGFDHHTTDGWGSGNEPPLTISYEDSEEFDILDIDDWEEIRDLIHDEFAGVRAGLNNWVSGVYDDVQSGDLDTEELLTPREWAEISDEEVDQAIADLMALNVAVDLDREAELYLHEADATIYGSLGVTGNTSVSAGDTIDPTATDHTYYINYDISQGRGEWTGYQDGLDGGVLTITQEPFEDVQFTVHTVAGETAEFDHSELAHDEENGEWTIDLSPQLDDSITEVDQIEYRSNLDETQYETIRLEQTFDVVTFVDSDGNEHDSAQFESSEAHDDSNYIEQEEWEEMKQRNDELIEKYKESQQNQAAGIWPDLNVSGFEAPGLVGSAAAGIVAVVLFLTALASAYIRLITP